MEQQQQAIEPFYTVSELAGLPGMPGTERGVLFRAKSEAWTHRPRAGRGGGREYALGALPAETQAALAQRHVQAGAVSGTAECSLPSGAGSIPGPRRHDVLAELFEAKCESIKAEARERLAVVREHEQLLARGFDRQAVVAAVCAEREISEATLARYLAAIKGEPEHVWLYLLAPRHHGRTVVADMSAEAWEILKADYLRLERPSARACINRLLQAAKTRDWTLPSKKTMERRLAKLPRSMKVLARQGAKALRDSFPAQQRAKAALHALEIVNADGYKHNLWVRFPDGEVVRAKTWFWQDVYSGKILAWRTDKTEHTDMIRLSFGDLVEHWGIPEAVLLDNTLAAANKTMSGGLKHRFRFKVRDEEPDGVFKTLGCRVMWATPELGRAKPIERGFGIGGTGEYIDKAPEFAGAWTGASPLDKPDYDGKTRAIDLAELQAVVAREIANWNALEGRRGAMARGRSFDAVFDESYTATPIRRATEAQRRLWLLATEPVRVARDGSITLNAGRIVGEGLANKYWNKDLYEHAGRMVAARFDPQRLHEGVHLYSVDGRYLGFAECDRPAAFNDQLAARERSRARNEWARGVKLARKAEQRMDVLEAAKALAGDAPATIPAPAVPERTVIVAAFGHGLQRPVAPTVTDEEMRAVEETWGKPVARAVDVLQLRSDAEREDYWAELNKRRLDGETLSGAEAEWWEHWQTQPYHLDKVALDRDFEQMLAERSACAPEA